MQILFDFDTAGLLLFKDSTDLNAIYYINEYELNSLMERLKESGLLLSQMNIAPDNITFNAYKLNVKEKSHDKTIYTLGNTGIGIDFQVNKIIWHVYPN